MRGHQDKGSGPASDSIPAQPKKNGGLAPRNTLASSGHTPMPIMLPSPTSASWTKENSANICSPQEAGVEVDPWPAAAVQLLDRYGRGGLDGEVSIELAHKPGGKQINAPIRLLGEALIPR